MNWRYTYYLVMLIIFITANILGYSNANRYAWNINGIWIECPVNEIVCCWKQNDIQLILLKRYEGGYNFIKNLHPELDNGPVKAFIFQVYNMPPGSTIESGVFDTVSILSAQGGFMDDFGRFNNAPIEDLHIIDETLPEELQNRLMGPGVDLYDVLEINGMPGVEDLRVRDGPRNSFWGVRYILLTHWMSPVQRTQLINAFWEVFYSLGDIKDIKNIVVSNFDAPWGDVYDRVVCNHPDQILKGATGVLHDFTTILIQNGFDILTRHRPEGVVGDLNVYNLFRQFVENILGPQREQHGGGIMLLVASPFSMALSQPPSLCCFDFNKFKNFAIDMYEQYMLWGKDAGLGEQFRGFIRSGVLIANARADHPFLSVSEVQRLLSDVHFDDTFDTLFFHDIWDRSLNDVEVPALEEVPQQAFLERPVPEIVVPEVNTNNPLLKQRLGTQKAFVAMILLDTGANIGRAFTPSFDWTDSRIIDPSINFKT
ncbi:MAG: hypothetical protein LBD03_06105 [Methanobrevibacter sp.]|nr:hypothetical protein [Candidatus Methanovirga procula]